MYHKRIISVRDLKERLEMPRVKNAFLLTEREMDVMKILWNSKNPLVASEIAKN
jgi:hypothetical protein